MNGSLKIVACNKRKFKQIFKHFNVHTQKGIWYMQGGTHSEKYNYLEGFWTFS
jgi:hypothetical protein